MAANANKGVRQQVARRSCQINNFGNVCKIIAAERDHVRAPVLNRPEKIVVRLALQIDQANRVPVAFSCCGHKLEPERLQPKINLRIHQTTGMNGKELHFVRTRRGLSSSWNAIAWKSEWTTRLLFILRILLGTRAYFSHPRGFASHSEY